MIWQERYESGSPLFRFYRLRKALILKNLPKEGLILEIGAGPGIFPELAGRVIALDVNHGVLKQGSYVRVCGMNESLPFRNSAFDAVVASGTLEYSLFPEAISEAHRVLREGGLLIASFANRLSVRRIWDREVYLPLSSCLKAMMGRPTGRPVHFRLNAPEAKGLLRQTGFRPIGIRFFDANPFPRPAERIFPGFANWLCDLLEPHAHPLIASQFIVIALKE